MNAKPPFRASRDPLKEAMPVARKSRFHDTSAIGATLNKSLVASASPLRAVCGVANPRDTARYHCGLRLAFHPAAGRAYPRELTQRRLRQFTLGVAA